MLEATIYYDEKLQNYPKISLEDVLRSFSVLSSKVQVLKKESDLTSQQMAEVVDEIRRIKPQSRGSIVAAGGEFLPISGSKRLNLQNTPVIIVRKDTKPVYVFPCKVGERYYGVLAGIEFLNENLPSIVELIGEMEDSIIKILSQNPEKLEKGLALDSRELEIETGKADLIFRCSDGRFLLVEVEREASDSAVGQVLRLASGFEKKNNLARDAIRAGIVCHRINDHILAACGRVRIEVWTINSKTGTFVKK